MNLQTSKLNITLLSRLKSTAFANFIRHFSQLMIGILVARYLMVEDKGFQFIFTSLASMLAILCSFGLANAIIFFAKKKLINFFKVIKFLTIAYLSIGIACIIIFFLVGGFLFDIIFEDREISLSIKFLFILLIFVSFTNYFINTLSLAFSLLNLYFLSFGLSSTFLLIWIFIGLEFFAFDIFNIIETIVYFELVIACLSLSYIFKNRIILGLNSESKTKDNEIFRYAGSCYLGVSGSNLSSNGDAFIVSTFLDQVALGLYSIAKTFYRLFALAPQLLNNVLFGYLSEQNINNAIMTVKKIIYIFIFVSIVILSISFFYLENFITLVFGINFQGAYLPSMIMLISAAILGMSSPINPLLLAFNKPLQSSYVVLIAGTAGIISSIFLTSSIGLIGTALATIISASLTSMLRLVFLDRLNNDK